MIQLPHMLTAAGDALTLVAASVMASGLVYVVVGAGSAAFVGCAVWARVAWR